MILAFLPLLLSAVSAAAGWQYEGSCRPTCSELLPRLPEVRLRCSPSAHLPLPEQVVACLDSGGFREPTPEGSAGASARMVAATPGVVALWGGDTRWTVCHADRISHRILSDAYFGAVWDAAADPCRQQYEVWLATENAPPCWQHNASDHLREQEFNQETALSLPQNRTYQCTYCNFSDYKVSEFVDKNYTFVLINDEMPKVFLYLSCNESGGEPYPTLKLVDSIYFTCVGCRRWIEFGLEKSLEYADCNTETAEVSRKPAVETDDGFIRKCKRDLVATTQPSTEETTPWFSSAAAGWQYEGPCRPTCSELLPRLPEVRLRCSPSAHLALPEQALACADSGAFREPPEGSAGAGGTMVAATPGVHWLRGDTRWTVCHADRISHRILSDAYFGAVWVAAADPCRQQYEVWLATENAPPCWQHNASDHLREQEFNQETAFLLPQNRTYQCTYCRFSDYTVSEFVDKNYTFVLIKDEIPKVFLYLSCNESGGEPYPTLKLVDSIYFTCVGCRRWIELGREKVFEHADCNTNTEEVFPKKAIETKDGFIRMCKRDLVSTMLPSTEETTNIFLNNEEANTEDTSSIPDIVQEALRQLDTKRFEDDALTNRNSIPNADQMLTNLDIVINFSKYLKEKQVTESLEGFELFARTVLHAVNTSEQQEVVVKHNRSTLVVAAGIVGAMVSSDGDKVEFLRYGQADFLSHAMLEQCTSEGVLLPMERDGAGPAPGIAMTVIRHEVLNTSFLHQGLLVNSDVISLQVEISDSSSPVNYVDIFLKPRVNGVRRRCGIWNLTHNTWDFDYCTLYRRGKAVDVCRCRHLTHFAQLVTDADLQWGPHARPLELLSLAGVCCSLLGFLGLAAAAVIDRQWRRKPGTLVLLQLGGAAAARDLLLALVSVDTFRPSWLWPPEDPLACRLLGAALHYALLAAAAWTTAAAVLQLLRLTTVAGVQAVVPHVVLVSSACSWLLPLLPVAALLAASGLEAGYPQRADSASDFLCYPQGVALYTAVVLPVALCMAVNAAIFLYLLLAVLFPVQLGGKLTQIRRHGSVGLRRRALTAAVLFFLLGLPWLLGPPARAPLLAYLFCLVATPQGMALFVSFVVCNGRLRRSLWASVSRAAFTSSSSAAGGYSRTPHATGSTRSNDSVSDAATLHKRHKPCMQGELELTDRERRP